MYAFPSQLVWRARSSAAAHWSRALNESFQQHQGTHEITIRINQQISYILYLQKWMFFLTFYLDLSIFVDQAARGVLSLRDKPS